MELGLFQKQSVDLVMTKELRQAIGLLQYNTTDLMNFIQEQAVDNPLIELEERKNNDQIEASLPASPMNKQVNNNEFVNPIDYTAQKENKLLDSLLEQINCLKVSDGDRDILKYITLNLDDNGYLSMNLSLVAEELDKEEARIEDCLSFLHQLEPIGIGARDAQECLLIQAKHHFPELPSMHHIIENHLYNLANKKWDDISQALSIPITEISHMNNLITTLNPKPCSNLFDSEVNFLFPDITINEQYGEYKITLSDGYLPKIKLNQDYYQLKNSHPHTSSYIKSNYQNYLWLVNSIEQRQSTIIKIAETIIKEQQLFLKHGFSHLEPMTMKDIAQKIDMHESTVSRATRNKVIRTPVGSFEMNQLFSAKLKMDNTNYASSTQVKLLLEEIISQENPKKPYSDQKLANILKEKKSVTISRRTVAKYREELNILSSTKRKQIV